MINTSQPFNSPWYLCYIVVLITFIITTISVIIVAIVSPKTLTDTSKYVSFAFASPQLAGKVTFVNVSEQVASIVSPQDQIAPSSDSARSINSFPAEPSKVKRKNGNKVNITAPDEPMNAPDSGAFENVSFDDLIVNSSEILEDKDEKNRYLCQQAFITRCGLMLIRVFKFLDYLPPERAFIHKCGLRTAFFTCLKRHDSQSMCNAPGKTDRPERFRSRLSQILWDSRGCLVP